MILPTDGIFHGGVILGHQLWDHVTYVTIENLHLERWFDAGISAPETLAQDENQNVVIRDNEIVDVDATGIRLTTWVWQAAANGNGPNGWRGGRNHTIENNVIDGANHYGLDFYGVASQVESNAS